MILARQPERGTNCPYLTDFIQICLSVKLLNSTEIRDLYEKKGLSSGQIASHFGVARATISARLNELGVKTCVGGERSTNPENYRQTMAPYGFSVKAGKLVPNKSDLKICRLVVELIQREGKTQNAVARELSKRRHKNRAGSSDWSSKTVFNIYKRWKDKL